MVFEELEKILAPSSNKHGVIWDSNPRPFDWEADGSHAFGRSSKTVTVLEHSRMGVKFRGETDDYHTK